MIFRSPFPDVPIPAMPLTSFVLGDANRHGAKPALVDASTGATMSYEALAADVRAVAAGLAQRGFARGDVLGIYAPNAIDYAVALFAVASLGGIVTPVSALATTGELARQLADAGASYLLATPALLDNARAAQVTTPIRETFVIGSAPGATPFAALRSDATAVPEVAIDPEDVVLLPYSSGTTGLPKGVMITHRSLVANLAQSGPALGIAKDDVFFCLPPFSHIYGAWLLSYALRHGKTLVFLPRFELPLLLDAIQRYRVTDAFLVPPVVLALANAPAADDYDLSSLRRINSAAAPLARELARRCQERIGCTLTQGYGMTEASPATHFMPMPGKRDKLGSIGPSLPNTECRIVDLVTGVDLGPNETGELWVRGPQVMKGYLNRPDATASAVDGDGWLRTGDIAYVDDDGDYYIVDRLKEMIKVRAYQVAPAELEAVLLAHPAVADAAVTPVPDDEAGEIPKAWIVLRDEATADEIIAYVTPRVASYKKIRAVEFIDQIPKSPSGKILRRVLVERDRAAAPARGEVAGVR